MRKPVEPDFQWIKPDGKPTQYFIELVRDMNARILTAPVSNTEPVNGDVLTFSTTTNKWEPT